MAYTYMPEQWEVFQIEQRKDNTEDFPEAKLGYKAERVQSHCCYYTYTGE